MNLEDRERSDASAARFEEELSPSLTALRVSLDEAPEARKFFRRKERFALRAFVLVIVTSAVFVAFAAQAVAHNWFIPVAKER